MDIKAVIKRIIRAAGMEIRRYCPERSDAARMERIFSYHQIGLVLDVGANVGQYARYIRDIGYRKRIVSFEPLAEAHAELHAASRKDDLWEIAPRMAIGDSDGVATINKAANSVSSSLLPMLDAHTAMAPGSAYSDTESVPVHKLDTVAPPYLEREGAVYLKIDVQGYEDKVLQGAAQVLPRIRGIQLELSLVPLYEGERLLPEMLGVLNSLGYDLYALIPGFTDNASGRLLQVDGIFFRREG